MRFQNLARFPDIGSNSYLLEMGSTRIILDAGTHPKHTGKDTLPLFESIDQDSVDGILVSHPHLDHIGSLPVLMQQQEHAAVAMTAETREFGAALLHNSVNVMKSQREELNEPDYPLYSHRKVDELERLWFTRAPGEEFSLGEIDRVRCEFYRAGHVLGAVGVHLKGDNEDVFYTGDVHFEDQTMTRKAEFPEHSFDTLIIETTRGGLARSPDYSREREKNRLGDSIQKTIDRGGAVLIPVFAFGKTQEVLLMVKELQDEGQLPITPVHIGGLSTKMSTIADRFIDAEGRNHQGYSILRDFPDLHILPRGQREPEFHPGHIYALSSGMVSEHTVSHRFAKRVLNSDKNSIFFVGYADSETPGGRILAAGQGGRVRLDPNRDHGTPILCEVDKFDFSGHAPRDQIVDYVLRCQPKNVILVHGDPEARGWFRQELEARNNAIRVILPEPGEIVEIDSAPQ